MMVESQEAMAGVVHPQRVFIAAERLVVFGFRAIGADLGLTVSAQDCKRLPK